VSQFIPLATPGQSYGRSINETCNYDFEGPYECRPSNTIPREPFLAFHNISTQNQIDQLSYAGHTYQYIGAPSLEDGLDFTGSTLAVESVCTPIGQRCLSPSSEFGVDCSALFQGSLAESPYGTSTNFPTVSFKS